jgi:hypothetical protein
MFSLPKPILDPFTEYTGIVQCKRGTNRTQLDGCAGVVLSRFNTYAANTAQLFTIAPHVFTTVENDALLHCYTHKTKALDSLKSRILNYHLGLNPTAATCRYCCIDPANTFDHYLPKDQFAEYAVHSLNLIPCCWRCNLLKGGRISNKSGSGAILNFYFDNIPASQFLVASVRVGVSTVQFSLSQNSADYGGLEDTRRCHFDALDLLNRYGAASAELIADIAEMRGQFTQIDLRQILLGEATSMITLRSPNYWKAVAYNVIASTPGFIASL